ncbi:PDC sensor domain-containing protein [Acidithiobacillus sp. AMEEHan]|uniref:PDC sensor domain-containing protein n=1 Tax=Acidithiobacillus sp. AMEEHan TaxID=2994951 RepID=UPI0027E56201|nr:PDC sensor domain-containing protein [Acidithiobacillus sp. AMEEHan]
MNRFEQFHESQRELHMLMVGAVESIASPHLFQHSAATRRRILAHVMHRHGFLDLLYLLDAQGVQLGDNVVCRRLRGARGGDGVDRSHRPYFRLARSANGPIVTEPYLSLATSRFCVTVAIPIYSNTGELLGVLVGDSELDRALSLLQEDDTRRSFEPFFKAFYALFSCGLLLVSASLGLHGFVALRGLWHWQSPLSDFTTPFQATILFTLALAVFDLAKTILEEEVLLRKDVRRHSSTRRTLTRFIAAIAIAVSIEGLMLVFKFALDHPEELWLAVLLLLATAMLLAALAVYVYFGAKAERILTEQRRQNLSRSGSPSTQTK